MKLVADIKAIMAILGDVEALGAGPISIEISAPVRVTITASDGKVVLDTTVAINSPQSS